MADSCNLQHFAAATSSLFWLFQRNKECENPIDEHLFPRLGKFRRKFSIKAIAGIEIDSIIVIFEMGKKGCN